MPLAEVPSGLSRFAEPSHLIFCQGGLFPTDNVENPRHLKSVASGKVTFQIENMPCSTEY